MTPEEKAAAVIALIKASDNDVPISEQKALTIVLVEVMSISESLRQIERHLGAIAAKEFSSIPTQAALAEMFRKGALS